MQLASGGAPVAAEPAASAPSSSSSGGAPVAAHAGEPAISASSSSSTGPPPHVYWWLTRSSRKCRCFGCDSDIGGYEFCAHYQPNWYDPKEVRDPKKWKDTWHKNFHFTAERLPVGKEGFRRPNPENTKHNVVALPKSRGETQEQYDASIRATYAFFGSLWPTDIAAP